MEWNIPFIVPDKSSCKTASEDCVWSLYLISSPMKEEMDLKKARLTGRGAGWKKLLLTG